MNHCAIQRNVMASAEEMRSSVSFSSSTLHSKQSVVCPKPRRLAFFNNTMEDPTARSRRYYYSYQAELPDSNAGRELMDMILSKGGHGAETERSSNAVVSSSAPFFCGSPPSRVSNPLIQDALFRDPKVLAPVSVSPQPSPIPTLSGSASSATSSARKGGYVRVNFGDNPTVRIEGFDCLDRDRRNCRIPALA
ncbi:hypothetical protein Dimus_031140 [Dionaea muscipula]